MTYKVVLISPKGAEPWTNYYCDCFQDAIEKATEWLKIVRIQFPDYHYRIKSITEQR